MVSPIKRYADQSAFYLGLGYQLGSIQHNYSNLNLSQQFNKSQIIFSDGLSPVFKNSYVSNGLGVQAGYKWVGKHEETKWFGFRWGINSLLYQVDFRRNYSVYFNYTYSF